MAIRTFVWLIRRWRVERGEGKGMGRGGVGRGLVGFGGLRADEIFVLGCF